jgi:hypothetical protein
VATREDLGLLRLKFPPVLRKRCANGTLAGRLVIDQVTRYEQGDASTPCRDLEPTSHWFTTVSPHNPRTMAGPCQTTVDTEKSGIRFFRNSTRVLFILLLLPWLPVAVWALVIINDGPATSTAMHLVSHSTLVYPLLVALSIFLTRNSRLQRLPRRKIAFLSLIPLLSPWPFMVVVLLIVGECSRRHRRTALQYAPCSRG